MKKLIISTLFVMQVLFVFGQNLTGISGKVIDAKTQKPLQNVVASIQNTNLTQITNSQGKFSFNDVPEGKQLLQVKSQGYKDQLLQIDIVAGKMLDLGVVVLDEDITEELKASTINISESELGDDNSGSESTSSLLQSSRDAFQQSAAFNWGQARFRVRGLDSEYGTTMINGVVMNKIYDGRPQWSNWGGLNDVTRNQEYTNGSNPSDYTFGGILGTDEINTRASLYRKGNRVSVQGTNSNYDGRFMGTMSSGMRNDGWAYTVSASRRFAQEGFYEGSTYNANSLFASVEKKISSKNSLNFTSIYALNRRGRTSASTQEITNAAGENYNSYWGWQGGEKKNARIKEIEEPILILSDYWKLTSKTNLNLNVSYQFGKIGTSLIESQGVDSPDPSYYKNLPSYYTSLYLNDDATTMLQAPSAFLPGGIGGINLYNGYATHNDINNPFDQPYINAYNGASTAKFLTEKQINWERIYKANRDRAATGLGSGYVLYENRTDDKQWNANAVLSSQLADNILLNASGTITKVKSHNFKNLLDLMGGNYFSDMDSFGKGDQREPDLNNPNRIVKEGDTFGYNYNLNSTKIDLFTQFKFTYKKVDFYLSQSFSRSEYQRVGFYKNGYYSTNSEGYSVKVNYDNFGFKGGLTYKITGRQFLSFNGAYMSKAPNLRNVFANARFNNNVTKGIQNENISSADVSYIINSPKLKTRLTAFYSKIQNQTETSFFFGDGVGIDDPTTSTDESNAFISEIVTNLNKKNIGLEFGMEYPITSTLKTTFSAAYGQYVFDNNPNISISQDSKATAANPYPTLDYGVAHIKNYKQSGTPQAAASFGLEYRDPKFWWIGVNANYLANNYIDIAPITRTDRFFVNPNSLTGELFPEATQQRADQLLKQEKFDDFALFNLIGGKSWKIKQSTFGFNASINNLLDERYKTGGFESARNSNYRELNQDVSSGTPAFGSKYFYGFGRTFSLNLYINF